MAVDEELAFERLYGPWRALTPAELAELMDGMKAPWWLAGGHAIEAFTGVSRPHEDADMGFFGRDLPELRRHFDGRYHLWSVHGTTFRPLTDEQPEPLDLRSQIWIREHAQASWLVDGLITPDVDGRWLSKRDPEHVADLDEVTWLDGDGVRYLDPEIVLLFKAAGDRRKDRRDLEVAWPLLDQEKQEWLARSHGSTPTTRGARPSASASWSGGRSGTRVAERTFSRVRRTPYPGRRDDSSHDHA